MTCEWKEATSGLRSQRTGPEPVTWTLTTEAGLQIVVTRYADAFYLRSYEGRFNLHRLDATELVDAQREAVVLVRDRLRVFLASLEGDRDG